MSDLYCPQHPDYDGDDDPPDPSCATCLDIRDGAQE
jgi:hypothetical protein